LQELGFKDYESRVFLVLIKGALLSATEIAKEAKIHRTAVYDILKSFAEKGYCNEIETNTILKYEIIDPKVILSKIENDYRKRTQDNIKMLNETFKELEPLYKSDNRIPDSTVNIELIRGFNAHREAKFIELFKKAKKEILFMIRFDGQVSEESNDITINFIKKGGKIKSIYEDNLNFRVVKDKTRTEATFDDFINICEMFESTGEDVRISTAELPNITIFDREVVFINIKDKTIPRHNKADIIIRNEDFAKRMMDLFEYYWNQAYTIREYKEVSKGIEQIK
jgi:sugar-specific transcriptional regulator TrmB